VIYIDSISTPSARVTAYKSNSYAFMMMIGAIPPITTKNTIKGLAHIEPGLFCF
jgi:hypothetical protein